MTVLIAADSFKDALPAIEVCNALQRGVRRAGNDLQVVIFPLADGGEGTAEILTFHSNGRTIELEVMDPLFRPTRATYGLSPDGAYAYIDMAQASGLQLLAGGERDPYRTSSYGTGQLILDATRRGARHLLLGIGGSATNDAGMGMATALGYRFLDKAGRELPPSGQSLAKVSRIDDQSLQFDIRQLDVRVLCDVDNPLFGPRGAAHVYAPQKGADRAMVGQLDEGLRHFAVILQEHTGRALAEEPGAGAAGGMGAGAMAFLGAALRPGIETIIEHTGFLQILEAADLLLTGEGRLDAQTLHGKLIHGLCRRAAQHELPVIAFCGSLAASPDQLEAIGLSAAFSILDRPMQLEEALQATEQLLERAAYNAMSTFIAGRETPP